MFNKVWSSLSMFIIALIIVLTIVILVANMPLTAPYVSSSDMSWLQFKMSFFGG